MSKPIIDSRYEHGMFQPWTVEYYGGSHFFNFGYWLADTRNQREASENLMEKMLAFIPDRQGKVLDVACGAGGTTRYLGGAFGPQRVTGVNISFDQLQRSKVNAPGSRFIQMDAAHLGFRDGSFDNVVCVEAAFHFATREDFLREAARILERDGRLVLTDILVHGWAKRLNRRIPTANYVKDLDAYRESYRRAGFSGVEILDVTRECWKGFFEQLWRWRREKYRAGEIKWPAYARMVLRNVLADAGLRYYLLVCATKS